MCLKVQCASLIITSLINSINRKKIKMVFCFKQRLWIFRPHFTADMQTYLNANFYLCYPWEVKNHRKIVTSIDLAVDKHVLEGNLVLKSNVCSESMTVIFAMDRRIWKTCLYCHCGGHFLELGKGCFSFCVLNWNENPAAATELPILFETGSQLLLRNGANREVGTRMILINSTSRTAEKSKVLRYSVTFSCRDE